MATKAILVVEANDFSGVAFYMAQLQPTNQTKKSLFRGSQSILGRQNRKKENRRKRRQMATIKMSSRN